MSLNAEQIDILTDKYQIGLWQDLEQQVITDIARRVRATGRYTETAEIMARNMIENGFSSDKINTEVMRLLNADKQYKMAVAENTKAYKAMVTEEIKKTVEEAKKQGYKLIADAGNISYNNDLSMWKKAGVDLTKPNTFSQLINAFSMQTNKELKNITRTLAFQNTANGNTAILNLYQRELDLAVLKMSTGTFSIDTAVNDCVHRLCQSGLKTVDYASGRSYQVDSAVRMAVRTSCSQLAGKITEANIESTGVDLVITSQHIGSRPEHAIWQNKVFAYKGHSKKYPDFVEATGYGTVTGLKGANCTHEFYPYWENISVKDKDIVEPEPVTVDGKEYDYYQATQKQRTMERSIRALKREKKASSNIGSDNVDIDRKIRAKTKEYNEFSKTVGIRAKENRLKYVS